MLLLTPDVTRLASSGRARPSAVLARPSCTKSRRYQAVEAVPGLGVELVVDVKRSSVDAHELGRGGLGVNSNSRVKREACSAQGTAATTTRARSLDPDRGVLDEGHHGAWSIVLHLLGTASSRSAVPLSKSAGGQEATMVPRSFRTDSTTPGADGLFVSCPAWRPGPLSEVDFLDRKTLPAAPASTWGYSPAPYSAATHRNTRRASFCPGIALHSRAFLLFVILVARAYA